MFHAESWDGRMLGCQNMYPAIKNATPNIDALAKRGTLFSNAYCTNPICCPSRANMLSGTYTHECESWNNYKGLEHGMWTYVRGMRDTHIIKLLGKHDDHLTGGHTIMNRVADMLEPLNTAQYPVMNYDAAQDIHISENTDIRYHEPDWRMLDDAREFINQYALNKKRSVHSKENKPFFLCLNPGLVHASFHTNQYWLNKIPEELVDLPPVDKSTHPFDIYQKKAKAWRNGFDDETIKKVRRIYSAMCAEADAIVGELVSIIKECGLDDTTTIIFSGDHGELAMEHQQYYKMSHYEGSVRVPLIITGADIKPGQVIDTPVSLIDMAPTICELAHIPQRENFSGESLMPLARGEKKNSRGWALAMNCGVTTNTISYMLRRGDYKLIAYDRYPSRLFNLKDDPQELHDLSNSNPDKLRELEHHLSSTVNRKETSRNWEDYRKHTFAQFRRQAKRGLFYDDSYSLAKNPSSDYYEILNNTFTGWSDEDESRVDEWLNS